MVFSVKSTHIKAVIPAKAGMAFREPVLQEPVPVEAGSASGDVRNEMVRYARGIGCDPDHDDELRSRIDALQEELATVKGDLLHLKQQFEQFKSQFE